jgi:glycosyltransferase involved in cell wall biosynthesis
MIINPKIAVVTPVYNGEKIIEQSIKSLLAQTFTDWVSVIVNDGSTDNTAKILEKYRYDDRFIVIDLEKNYGRPFARNLALEKVKEINAKYMCMLDADDLYYTDKLEWQFDHMEINSELSFMSCSLGYIDSDINLVGVLECYEEDTHFHFVDYKYYNSLPHACSIIRVNDIGDVTFDPKMSYAQDQDFMIRLLKNKKYSYVPRIAYLYNRTDSFSFKKYKKTKLLEIYSKGKLGYSTFDLFKYKLYEYFKLGIVFILSFFNLEKLYLKKIGRTPTKEELIQHNFMKKLF